MQSFVEGNAMKSFVKFIGLLVYLFGQVQISVYWLIGSSVYRFVGFVYQFIGLSV